jgi:hypothetical protein
MRCKQVLRRSLLEGALLLRGRQYSCCLQALRLLNAWSVNQQREADDFDSQNASVRLRELRYEALFVSVERLAFLRFRYGAV